ncbi:MAG TPA: hypothetical protein VI056_05465 [Candidatus Limnocylindria bacterium]
MDKATSFGLPFFYRVVLPGTIVVVLLSPLLGRVVRVLADPLQAVAGWVGLAVFAGIVIAALDDPIYEVLEGRRLWPNWLYQWRRRRWQRYVNHLRATARRLPQTDWRYLETWDRLRRFPTREDGTPVATRPTKLGNVLASSEDYSLRVYGLHAVAYWERLWLVVPKDEREEIDRSAALADGWTYVTAAVLFVGVFYVALAIGSAMLAAMRLPIALTADERIVAVYGGIALVLAARLPYSLSLPEQARRGETMKAMFDLYRERLERIRVPASPVERAEAERIGTWLVYGDGTPAPTEEEGRQNAAG